MTHSNLDLKITSPVSNIHTAKKASELNKHIWKLKDSGTTFTINWKTIEKVKSFSPVTGQCKLCLREKYLILTKPHLGTLNSRDEILSACRHKQCKLLAKPG